MNDINDIKFRFVTNLKEKAKISDDFYVTMTMTESMVWFEVETDNELKKIKVEEILEKCNFADIHEAVTFFKKNNHISVADFSEIEEYEINFRTRLNNIEETWFVEPYLIISQENVSTIVDFINFINKYKTIKFKNVEYDSKYFDYNFFLLYYSIENKTSDGWIYLKDEYIYKVENGKIVLKIKDKIFYLDEFFFNCTKIYFHSKRYFDGEYNILINDVCNYIHKINEEYYEEQRRKKEFATLVLSQLGSRKKETATAIIKIDNDKNNYHTTYKPIEIEIPYHFGSYIKSEEIKRVLRREITPYDQGWVGDVFTAEINFNGRTTKIYF